MKKKYEGKVALCMPHSLIIGHCPDKLKMENIASKLAGEAREITSLGLFDSAAPNFNTYYPEVTKEDLNPDLDTEAFIHPVYRGLSEVIVHKNWNPIDFSEGGVLKAAAGMLKGQTVYTNHEMLVGNELGAIEEVYWQDAYTTNSGIKVPAGVNVKLKVDGKSNPKIARGMMMTPPSIHSVSVTVSFEWEPSHEFEDPNTFWRRLGEVQEDGTMVRRIVTAIKGFHEISTVHHGADPFAQKIGDNDEIVNPEYADRVSNSTVATDGTAPFFQFDYALDIIRNAAEEETTPTKSNNNNTTKMKKELLTLCALLGITTEGLSDEQGVEKLTASIKELQEVTPWDDEKANGMVENATKPLDEKVTELEGKITEFTNAGNTALDARKGEVVELLNKLHDNSPAEALVTSLDNLDMAGLDALHASYEAQFEAKAPLCCEECGSDSVSRRSSAELGGGEGEATDKNKPTNDMNKSLNAFRSSAKNSTASFMDEEDED